MKRLIPDFRTSLQWLLLAFVLIINFKTIIGYSTVGGDLDQDYAAALAIKHGISIYGEAPVLLLSLHTSLENIQENFHPPSSAILAIPLLAFSPSEAFIIWNTLSLILLAFSFLAIWQKSNFSSKYRIGALGFFLFSYPVYSSLANAQLSPIIVFCIVMAWLAYRNNHNRLEGFFFGLAALLKMFPLLLLLFPAFRKNWCSLFYACYTIILGSIITWAVVGLDDCVTYFTKITSRNIELYSAYPHNISVRGLLTSLFAHNAYISPLIELRSLLSTILFLSNATIILISIIALHKYIIEKKPDVGLAILINAMILLSPISWEHILPITLLSLAIVFQSFSKKRLLWLILICGLISFTFPNFLVFNSLYTLYHYTPISSPLALLVKLPCIGLLIIWFFLCLKNNTKFRED